MERLSSIISRQWRLAKEDDKFYSIETDLKEFYDKLNSAHDSSQYPEDRIDNRDYFINDAKVNYYNDTTDVPINNIEIDNTNRQGSPPLWDSDGNVIYYSDLSDDDTSLSSNDIFFSDDDDNYNNNDHDNDDATHDDVNDNYDNDELSINKTTLQYKSQLNHDRFHVPIVDPIVPQYQDRRDFLTVARDVIRILEGKMNQEEIKFMSMAAGFDVSSPSYYRNGYAKLKSTLLEEMREYKAKNKLSDRDIKRTDEVIEATKKSKGLLPKDVVRTGFSPAPTKDFIDGNYCDEGHSGPGLFDDPDDPDDPQHQNVNATISEPRPCHCRSYKHHISSCPSPGKHCTSTNCLSVYDENCPQLEYIFECLCHPIESPPSFNTIPEDDYHLKTTDPTYIIKLHNSLVPKIANMDRNEKYLMRKTKECKFHLNDSYSKKLERLHLKYFASLPEKILKSNSLKSEYKEINLSSSNNTDNQLSYLTSQKWLTVAIFRKWQGSSVALWIKIAVISQDRF